MSSFVNLLDVVYPIGSVYCSMESTTPATLFGGTWTQVKSKFLYGSTLGKTEGGSTSHFHYWYLNWVEYNSCLGFLNNQEQGASMLRSYNGDSNYRVSIKEEQSQWTHRFPSDSNNSTVVHANPEIRTMTAKTTANTSYLPPYITCYMWYRTA